jgi:diadenosine tetraphosphatase ApaH/serine/threonine PP2A family protein phosphatase
MRIALIADVHSNLEALEAVLRDATRRRPVDAWWCLGDIVGYGPDPTACLERVRELGALCIAGNHDWGAVGKVALTEFNAAAAAACRWNGEHLGQQQHDFLGNLPLTIELGPSTDSGQPLFTLAHGSPRDPIWEYLLSPDQALECIKLLNTPHGLVGHSHLPLWFALNEQREASLTYGSLSEEAPLSLSGARFILNPGSVGQPRDGDPRAAYAIYDGDSDSVTSYRVEYDIPSVQAKVIEAGLPVSVAQRLSMGW